MENLKIHIRVLFEWMQPELLLDSIRSSSMLRLQNRNFLRVDARGISHECYAHTGRFPLKLLTEDELDQLFYSYQQEQTDNVFRLPALYGQQVLRFDENEPVFRQGSVLEWNQMTRIIAPDLFICSLCAEQDIRHHLHTTYFAWPSVIGSDNVFLHKMLTAGLAENHFHLNGSPQVFSLAWGYLMNHPNQANAFFAGKGFREDRQGTVSQGISDNHLPWKTRICYAAWIRAHLFQQIEGLPCPDSGCQNFFDFDRALDQQNRAASSASMLRFRCGCRYQQPDHSCQILDYVLTPAAAQNNPGFFRFLAGERIFLYECFRRCFDGSFSPHQQDLFYLYLLIQIRFRGEMIQSNSRMGFDNFSEYQDRKALGWGDKSEYWIEGRRLAINGSLSQNVSSLELRIMPALTMDRLVEKIRADDEYVRWADYSDSQNNYSDPGRKAASDSKEEQKHFFVLHFGKKQLPRQKRSNSSLPLAPRNDDVRRTIRQQAMVLAASLEKYPALCTRIRGIDACSHEIGCRPETFATEFRFLRGFVPQNNSLFCKTRNWPRLGATYHVGEDYLELADGLRAIDECISFLKFDCGDRLGHALALGVSPQHYYELKHRLRVLPKQDLLDNLVWLLFRCREWKIPIPHELSDHMRDRARQLLNEIYNVDSIAGLLDYFNSWKLRGDHPSLYLHLAQQPDPHELSLLQCSSSGSLQYYRFLKRHDVRDDLDQLRSSSQVRKLMYQYHYDSAVRFQGQKAVNLDISPDYMDLLERVQDKMMELLMEKGICIECNPSSNKLIGPFDSYEMHPIFRFNNYGLESVHGDVRPVQLLVSVNTDDQGVFGTSLENEYALLMGALQSKKDADGHRLYSDDQILTYLDRIRNLGNHMTFCPSSPKSLGRHCDC